MQYKAYLIEKCEGACHQKYPVEPFSCISDCYSTVFNDDYFWTK